jgi:3'(2'), 5'-bisphosphate nucleotidase
MDDMSSPNTDLEITPQHAARLLDQLTAIVARASAKIIAIPLSEAMTRAKDDLSPVTAADHASNAAILAGLARVLPGIPVVSEESLEQAPSRLTPSFIIVDPLDGTKEFLAGRNEYTVNIGIVTHDKPIAGVISAPAQGLLWRAVIGGQAERLRMDWNSGAVAEQTIIRTRGAPDSLMVATSRTHLDPRTEQLLSRFPGAQRYPCGSSVKFCHLAQGDADLYPRLSPTCEWDIAAGCAILAAAGGQITDPDGGELRFGSMAKKFLVPGFIAWGDPKAARLR